MDIGHLISLFSKLLAVITTNTVYLSTQGKEESVSIASCDLSHLKVKSDLYWLMEDIWTVWFLDSKLTDLIVATSTNWSILTQQESLVATTGHVHDVFGFGEKDRSVSRCDLITYTQGSLSVESPSIDIALVWDYNGMLLATGNFFHVDWF